MSFNKYKILAAFAFGALYQSSISTAYADIYNCNGKWQNKPCANGEATQTIEEEAHGSGFPGDKFPKHNSATSEPKKATDLKGDGDAEASGKKDGEKNDADKKGEKKDGGEDTKGGKCPAGQKFTTTRPNPNLDFQYFPENAGKASGKLKVEGTIKGHGAIKVVLTLTQRGEERQAWSKNFSLPDDGGDEDFSKTVDLPVGASYKLAGTNTGSFRGYCSGPGSGNKDEQ